MLRIITRLALVTSCSVALLLGEAVGLAHACEIYTCSKPKPKPKVDVTSQPGKVTGAVSMVTGKSDGGNRRPAWRGKSKTKKKVPDAQRRAVQDACWRQLQDVLCFDNGGDPLQALGLTGPVARAMAVQLITRLQLPTPQPQFGPNPNDNEWNMLTVGYPIWLWTNGPTTVTTTTSGYGFTFHMTARWRSTTFHTGDQHTVTCTRMTKHTTTVKPGSPSPTCGHTYQKPSLPKGHYTVQAIANWDVTWTVAGLTGTLPAHNQATATIPIGELTALNR